MAIIARDASANNAATGLTWSHTCAGTDRVLFVGGRCDTDPTAITYNGVSMTKLRASISQDANFTFLWYLFAPATGTHTISVTAGAQTSVLGNSVSYQGVLQSGMPDASSVQTITNSSTLTGTITTSADQCWILAVGSDTNGAGILNGVTSRTTITQTNNSSALYDNNGPQTPPASVNFQSLNDSASNANLALLMASFAPSATPIPAKGAFLLKMIGL